MAGLCRRNDLVFGCIGLSERDILAHRSGFDPCILQNHTEILPQAPACEIGNSLARDADFSAVHIVKAHKKVNKRRLTAARRADDRHTLARAHRNVEVFNERPVGYIPEADVLELHASVGMLQRNSTLRVRCLRRLVDELKHTPRAGHRVLKLGHNAGNIVEGLRILVRVAEEHRKSAHRNTARNRHQRARQRHAGIDDAVDKAGDGVRQRREERRAQRVFLKPSVNFVERLHSPFLP